MPQCTPGTDSDGDNIDNCVEDADGDPFTDRAVFNGFHAMSGAKPEFSGSCNLFLPDYAKVEQEFKTPKMEQDVWTGWAFETGADDLADAAYGFQPNWPKSASGRYQLRFRGKIHLATGPHCFHIDIGATGTGLGDGKNSCGQIYLAVSGVPDQPIAETGVDAKNDDGDSDAATGCVTIATDGNYDLDIVYRHFWLLGKHDAKLDVRHCAGAACTPSEPIAATMVQVR